MVASRHTGANLGPLKEVVTGHLGETPSSGVPPSLEVLIRKLVEEARSGPDACAELNDHRKGQVIVDTEVDGIRCLLTWLERYPPSQISFSPRESEIGRMVAKGYP